MLYYLYKYRKGYINNIFQNPEASAASYIAGKVTHIDEGAEILSKAYHLKSLLMTIFFAGTEDGSRPGRFYVNTAKY